MRNIRLVVGYDGTEFAGWQTQPPGTRTVQETLQNAIFEVIGERVHANASGRTDAGVHAVGQVVNFRTSSALPAAVIHKALVPKLPGDLCVVSAEEAAAEFNACTDAVRKLYRYVIIDGAKKNPFLRRYAFHCKFKLDCDRMREASLPLVGRHDFHSFETHWPNRDSSVRTVTRLAISRVGEYIWIDIEADGFLYNMVRSIVGTLVNVGRGFWPVECVKEILEAEDRAAAGPTAPPEGLFLMRVSYG